MLEKTHLLLTMQQFIDLKSYPLDQPRSDRYAALVNQCQQEMKREGMFNLQGFVNTEGCNEAVAEIAPLMNHQSFTHRRAHNIYFEKDVPGLPPDHPALQLVETVNHTVCADQLQQTVIMYIYEYAPLRRFLADVMDKAALYLMDDPLARANVMAYRQGEALNWHFDRSEFTTTLLLQAPEAGGEFQYRKDLRADNDPNYDGVARLLMADDDQTRSMSMPAGTLNVFLGKNTAHRVTPVEGNIERMVAVLSYYEKPGRLFTVDERIGFYGRAT